MKKKESRASRIADALDLPLDVMCDIPRVELMGKKRISIENFRGVLDYNENCIKINSTEGIIKIDGDSLLIESITDEGIFIKGTILRVEYI